MDESTLSRVVRQHAETSRLMGVDFVPAYRGDADGGVPATPDVSAGAAPTHARASEPEPQSAVVMPAARAVLAEGRSATVTKDRAVAIAALDALRARYEAEAPHKQFVTAHTRIVWGDGDPCARLVFVGEAPGEEEDRAGIPFVGRSGQLLNKMIGAMGLTRDDVYICNVLKTRPPNNATPTGREIELCEPYLKEQIAIINPEVIVTLGLPASRALLRSEETMTRMRGRWRTYTLANGRQAPLMPTFHPAYVLRNYTAETRGLVWSDLRQVMERMGLTPTGSGVG